MSIRSYIPLTTRTWKTGVTYKYIEMIQWEHLLGPKVWNEITYTCKASVYCLQNISVSLLFGKARVCSQLWNWQIFLGWKTLALDFICTPTTCFLHFLQTILEMLTNGCGEFSSVLERIPLFVIILLPDQSDYLKFHRNVLVDPTDGSICIRL